MFNIPLTEFVKQCCSGIISTSLKSPHWCSNLFFISPSFIVCSSSKSLPKCLISLKHLLNWSNSVPLFHCLPLLQPVSIWSNIISTQFEFDLSPFTPSLHMLHPLPNDSNTVSYPFSKAFYANLNNIPPNIVRSNTVGKRTLTDHLMNTIRLMMQTWLY